MLGRIGFHLRAWRISLRNTAAAGGDSPLVLRLRGCCG
jgi:hypothetical protein